MSCSRTVFALTRAALSICVAGWLTLGFSSVNASAKPCALALVLAIDVSGSVDQGEYRLQMSGLAAALRSEDVANALASVGNGVVYMSAIHWSGTGQQAEIVPWTLLDRRENVLQFEPTGSPYAQFRQVLDGDW